MKWIIILTIISGISFIVLLINAIIDGIEAEPITGTITHFDVSDFEPGGVFQENDYFVDEHSPENLNIEKALKIGRLKNKLNKIEEERETEIDNINVDYQNYEGK